MPDAGKCTVAAMCQSRALQPRQPADSHRLDNVSPSLPPPLLSLSSPLPLSLTRHPSRFSFPSLPSLSPFHPTVFLVLHQSAVSRPALARHVRTASCSASLSLSLSVDQPVGGFFFLFCFLAALGYSSDQLSLCREI